MPRVLGVDPSLTAFGLCRIDVEPGGDPVNQPAIIDVCTLSTFKPRLKTKREYSVRVSHTIDQVECALEGVDLVSMEGLAYGAKGEAVWVLPWIFGRVIDLCEKHDKELIIVATSQRARYATGKGNANKEAVLLAAVARFPGVTLTNNNESDALICAAVGCRHLGFPVDSMPKSHYEDVMTKIGI